MVVFLGDRGAQVKDDVVCRRGGVGQSACVGDILDEGGGEEEGGVKEEDEHSVLGGGCGGAWSP